MDVVGSPEANTRGGTGPDTGQVNGTADRLTSGHHQDGSSDSGVEDEKISGKKPTPQKVIMRNNTNKPAAHSIPRSIPRPVSSRTTNTSRSHNTSTDHQRAQQSATPSKRSIISPRTSTHETQSNGLTSPRSLGMPSPRAHSAHSPRTPTSLSNGTRPATALTTPSPNLRNAKSRIKSDNTNYTPGGGNLKIVTHKVDVANVTAKCGSKANLKHTPGGGDVKVENKKLEWKAASKVGSVNNTYTPGGGQVKIESKKLNWEAKSKVGSLDKAHHKPGGGEVKIISEKLGWQAESKVGSLKNAKHAPGGGNVKIHSEKVQWKTGSKVGSLENASHTPGGGEVKIQSAKLDFKEKAQPKIGSKDNMEHRPGGGDIMIVTHKLDFKEKAEPKIPSLRTTSRQQSAVDENTQIFTVLDEHESADTPDYQHDDCPENGEDSENLQENGIDIPHSPVDPPVATTESPILNSVKTPPVATTESPILNSVKAPPEAEKASHLEALREASLSPRSLLETEV